MLTDEDRKRIYEEEKARIEAREQLTGKTSRKPSNVIGCVTFLVLTVVIAVVCWPKGKPVQPSSSGARGGTAPGSDAGPSAQTSQDDYQDCIRRYGPPDEMLSTEYDNPRPAIPTRSITYRPENVEIHFIPVAEIGAPPPYARWKAIGAKNLITKKVLSIEEMYSLLRGRERSQ